VVYNGVPSENNEWTMAYRVVVMSGVEWRTQSEQRVVTVAYRVSWSWTCWQRTQSDDDGPKQPSWVHSTLHAFIQQSSQHNYYYYYLRNDVQDTSSTRWIETSCNWQHSHVTWL